MPISTGCNGCIHWKMKKNVITFLINHYIPTHCFPKKIRSDNGTHLKNKDLQAVETALGLKHSFGSVYLPQSQGKVGGWIKH